LAELAVSNKQRINKIEYFFSKKVGTAIYAHRMIEADDRILVAVSGGKDSLSLLKVLHYKQGRIPVEYDIIVCHIDFGSDHSIADRLESYFKDNDYKYVIERAKRLDNEGSFRIYKVFFETAKKLGCNKLALSHHKDDIAESFLLNLFFRGKIELPEPNQPVLKGRLRMIRPLCLCDESAVNRYAKTLELPQLDGIDTDSSTSKRMRMKDILQKVSEYNKDVRTNISRSMQKIKYDYLIKEGIS
jgi:tRNA 2-thiocytidine biosynthesis protein TtcA